jgi:hypothetical protein
MAVLAHAHSWIGPPLSTAFKPRCGPVGKGSGMPAYSGLPEPRSPRTHLSPFTGLEGADRGSDSACGRPTGGRRTASTSRPSRGCRSASRRGARGVRRHVRRRPGHDRDRSRRTTGCSSPSATHAMGGAVVPGSSRRRRTRSPSTTPSSSPSRSDAKNGVVSSAFWESRWLRSSESTERAGAGRPGFSPFRNWTSHQPMDSYRLLPPVPKAS